MIQPGPHRSLSQLAYGGIKNIRRLKEVGRCIQGTPQWRQWIASYVLGKATPFPATFRTRCGQSIELCDWSELTTVWRVFYANEYQVPADTKTIVDAGANIGAFALYQAVRMPDAQIVAVEPFPGTFARLVQTIEQNHLGSRVRAIQAALTDHTGTACFDAAPATYSYARQIVEPRVENAVQVRASTLGDILDEVGWSEVDYLKMDIEGAEYGALGGVPNEMLRRCRAIGVEYHDSSRVEVLWRKMAEAGFERVSLRPDGWSGLAEFRRG